MNRRHRFLFAFLRPAVRLFAKVKFNFSWDVAEVPSTPFILLSNHNTDYDPLLVGCGIKKHMYFVASEHIFRWPTAGRLLKYWFDPIARSKGGAASSTVMEIFRRLRAGDNVCMFAEGNRSWDGVTGEILPSTGKMVKSSKASLVTYRITGGYFTSPRWSDKLRRGKMHGATVNVYDAATLASMSAAEINEAIKRDLYEDANSREAEEKVPFRGRNLAKSLESMLFRCPECGANGGLTSGGNTLSCSCGFTCTYGENGLIAGGPYKTVREWDTFQRAGLRREAECTVFEDGGVTLTKLDAHHNEVKISSGRIRMDKDALSVGGNAFPISSITELAMHGRLTVVFTCADGGYYEMKPDSVVNMYKYFVFYRILQGRTDTD